MRLKYFFTILAFIISGLCSAQENHYIVLQERPPDEQLYNYGKSFPNDWIKKNWKKNYFIKIVNFKNDEWFVVMSKSIYPGSQQQSYLVDPTNLVVKEKLKDGFKITEICAFVTGNKVKSFFLFSKVSSSPINNYYFFGKQERTQGQSYSKPSTVLKDRVDEGMKRGYHIDKVRSLTYGGQTYLSILMSKNFRKPHQIYVTRKEFPNNFVNNKKKDGYRLSSITYDEFDESWFVVMTKYNRNNTSRYFDFAPWTWLNFKSQKNKMDDYINNKDYVIIGVY